MGWGLAIGAGLSLLGMDKANDSAKSQNAMAMEQLALDRQREEELAGYRKQLWELMPEATNRQDMLFDFVMDQNLRNLDATNDYRDYTRQWADQERRFKSLEQDFERYRISEADRLAAEERTRQLEALIDDQATTQAERNRALEELEYTRSIASGERAYDMRQYEADQMQAQLEYQYRVQEYEKQRGIANQERQREIDFQERILREAGILQDTIDRTVRSFDPVDPFKRYGEDDVSAAAGDFFAAYQADADRAADRLASVNEADLIRRGMDASTTGDQSRATLLREQLVPLYDTARQKARQDALGYVTGLQNNEIQAFNSLMGSRAAQIDESVRGHQSMVDIINNLRNAPSARITDYMNLGTGNIGPRNLTSAGNYSAPINIGSQVLSRNLGIGMDNSRGFNTSIAGTNPSGANGIFTPMMPDYMSVKDVASAVSGVPVGSNSNFSTLASGASSAGNVAGQHLQNFGANVGQFLDEKPWQDKPEK